MSEKNDVVIINLDRPRVIRFGHKALKNMLAVTGKDLDNLDLENLNLEELEKIMYFGLLSDARQNNETLNLEDMEDLLDLAPTFSDITEKMIQALNIAFGQFEVDQKNLERIVENNKKTK